MHEYGFHENSPFELLIVFEGENFSHSLNSVIIDKFEKFIEAFFEEFWEKFIVTSLVG